jgi:Ca2+-binding EF-hand superfamily protein
MSREQIEAIVKQADSDGSGGLSFEEFIKLLTRK